MPDRAARLAKLNPGVDEKTLAKVAPARDERAIGQKRGRTGATFQQQLDGTHENYLNRGWGFVLRQHGPFIKTARRGWQPSGYARCDYAGHVNVVPTSVHLQVDLNLREHTLHERGTPTPVYFDAKVLGKEHATYTHPVEQQHQLIDLRAALRGGGYAFLLVLVPQLERVVMIGIAEHFQQLMRPHEGVLLYDTPRRMIPGDTRVGAPTLPSCEWSNAIGWHYAPLLQFIQRGER